jgi:hypothetical protein
VHEAALFDALAAEVEARVVARRGFAPGVSCLSVFFFMNAGCALPQPPSRFLLLACPHAWSHTHAHSPHPPTVHENQKTKNRA